jgi:cell division protein FtsB
MGFWRYLVLIVIIALLGWGVYGVVVEKGNLSVNADALRAELGALDGENQALESDISYYANPENLVKAIKEQFNYRAPDEKLIILVSPSTSSASSTE